MSDPENIRWCPACKQNSLDGDERFCDHCCKVLDQLFPGGAWHDMETEDLIEHYHCGADTVYVEDDEDDGGIPPVSEQNAQKEEKKESFFDRHMILILLAVVVLSLLILFLLRDT